MHDNSNVIIICFNPYSCGKFLSNILSYNKNFIPQFPFSPDKKPIQTKDIDYNQMSFSELLYLKHDVILRSLPPKEKVTEWEYYELGCEQFWGTWADDLDTKPIARKAKEILGHGTYCFIMGHTPEQTDCLIRHFPFAKIIKIVNDQHINLRSRRLKIKEYKFNLVKDELKGYEPKQCLQFDISSLFNQEHFFKNVYQLLEEIGIQDCSLDPQVFEYYQKYCNLYQDVI